jgi:DNA-binding transcriptional LysR family regulator
MVDYLTAARAFVRVVETGSFAKAADSLEFPRNTVTKLVQSLEAHLRVKLLNRTTRKVATTNDGDAYFQRMVRLLEEWDEVENELSQARSSPRGRLRVDMGASLASLLVIPTLAAFKARYPEVQIDLGVSDRSVDLIDERVDCVVRVGAINDPSLIARHLGDIPFVTCAAPAYLADHGTPSHPGELEHGHALVRYFFAGSRRSLPVALRCGDEQVTIRGSYFISVNESNAMLAAGLAGLGVVHAPAFIVMPHIESGQLTRILPSWSGPSSPIFAVYPASRHLSSRTRVFVDWMIEVFQQSRYTLPPGRPAAFP